MDFKLWFLLVLQVNYLGPYVLTRLLEDSLVAGAPSRVQLNFFENYKFGATLINPLQLDLTAAQKISISLCVLVSLTGESDIKICD